MNNLQIIWLLWLSLCSGRKHSCGTKVNYKFFQVANNSAKKMSVKFNKELVPYPCIWCHGWHIGSRHHHH